MMRKRKSVPLGTQIFPLKSHGQDKQNTIYYEIIIMMSMRRFIGQGTDLGLGIPADYHALCTYIFHLIIIIIINVKKILAVINATYTVAKRKPEKIRLS